MQLFMDMLICTLLYNNNYVAKEQEDKVWCSGIMQI